MFQETIEVSNLSRKQLPREIGVYCWIDKRTKELVYIGSATGERGLRGRIWEQHLNPNYLETRKEKFYRPDLREASSLLISAHRTLLS